MLSAEELESLLRAIGQRERREPAADVRLDGDEMTADPDDGDAVDETGTYI
jgi:hypothetical protein